MSTVAQAIFSRLSAAQSGDTAGLTAALATVAGYVGTGTAARVYPNISDDETYPLIVYDITQEEDEAIQSRTTKEYTMYVTGVVTGQGAYLDVHTMMDAVRTLLDRQTGTWASIAIRCFFKRRNERRESDGPDNLYYEIEDEYHIFANT